jgi:hypothetical protein
MRKWRTRIGLCALLLSVWIGPRAVSWMASPGHGPRRAAAAQARSVADAVYRHQHFLPGHWRGYVLQGGLLKR